MTGAEMLAGGEDVDRQEPVVVTTKTEPSATELALRQANKTMRQMSARLTEAERNAQYWHERSQQPQTTKKETPVVEENAADFIEQLTEKGPAAIDELLAKRGYMRRQDVDAQISAVRAQATVEASLAKDFPDLTDETSDFFKETAKQYNELIADNPALKNSPKTMRVAARLAAAELDLAEEKPARKAPKASDLEDDDELEDDEVEDTPERRETSRVRRVQAQTVGSRRTRREAADDNTLDATQKSIVANLRAAGANITEDKLIKRIQGGTRLSGRIGMAAAAMRRGRR